MVQFEITLNGESAAVLLRCLDYGNSAVSTNERKSGVAEVIQTNIQMLRSQVCSGLSEELIKNAATK